MNEPIEIPNKSTFKINEVCALTGVKSYVLRFWESEFTEIAPFTSATGIKLYEHRDIEAILIIKKLLFEDKFSIEKAKREIKIIMPTVRLVEDRFSNFEEENVNIDLSSEEKTTAPAVEVTSVEYTYSQSKRVLVESDIQKLVMAKSKLTQILELTEVLNQRNNWH